MKKYYYLLSISIILCLFSCNKDFLDIEDNSVVLAEQYVEDLNTARHYMNGVYVVLAKDFYHGYYQIYPDLIADNIKLRAGSNTLINQYTWQQSATQGRDDNNNMNSMWQFGYQLARSCSFVIEKTGDFNAENPIKAKQLQAEAYATRALVHFVLVNIFAQSYNYSDGATHPGIPYVTSLDWTEPITRSTTADVYMAMINDLTKALSLYDTDITHNSLVMNKTAAKALLARIYLFKEDWLKAKSLAGEVTNSIPLMTGNFYPSALFTLQESEALFQLSPAATAVMGSYNTFFPGRMFNNRTGTLFLASKDVVNLLRQNPQDARTVWVKAGAGGTDTIIKFPVDKIKGFNPTSGSYYPTLLRSSEMYLTIAEAAAQLGEEGTAREYLDAIRKRADPTAANSAAIGHALLDSIYVERRKELSFEGLRMFDLQRWKKDVLRTDPLTPSVAHLLYPNDKAIAPIPLNDVQFGIPQNTEY